MAGCGHRAVMHSVRPIRMAERRLVIQGNLPEYDGLFIVSLKAASRSKFIMKASAFRSYDGPNVFMRNGRAGIKLQETHFCIVRIKKPDGVTKHRLQYQHAPT